jgi:hypothetical protein
MVQPNVVACIIALLYVGGWPIGWYLLTPTVHEGIIIYRSATLADCHDRMAYTIDLKLSTNATCSSCEHPSWLRSSAPSIAFEQADLLNLTVGSTVKYRSTPVFSCDFRYNKDDFNLFVLLYGLPVAGAFFIVSAIYCYIYISVELEFRKAERSIDPRVNVVIV